MAAAALASTQHAAATEPLSQFRRASSSAPPDEAINELYAALVDPENPPALVMLFFAPNFPREQIRDALARRFEGIQVIGCTTAGEITPAGYARGTISAVAFPASEFQVITRRIDHLSHFRLEDGAPIGRAIVQEGKLAFDQHPAHGDCFALLLADGASRQEEALVSTLATGLGGVVLFGGSAACGLDFDETFILHEGRFHSDAALVVLMRSALPFKVFQLDHFEATGSKMVVTEADPDLRLVSEINAEPAAIEYARLVGVPQSDLSPTVFANYPVLVRVGGKYHVRSIQRVEPDGSLRFFCAIDEGLVLTVAQARNIGAHLDEALAEQAGGHDPLLTLAFDCVYRRIEAEQTQATRRISEILRHYNTVGFSTYGEQYQAMHVNQTFTGIMFFAPDREPGGGHE